MYKDIHINFPPDEHGFLGRECPECQKYFKVKLGTGLSTSTCYCPYCGHTADYEEFVTKDQLEYAKTMAIKKLTEEVIKPEIKKLERKLKELEKATRGGPIQIKIETQYKSGEIPISYYQEKEVETQIKCDNCGLEFAIYGVFANCPDCGKLNASIIFAKSIEVPHKRINLIGSVKNDADLQEAILEDALSGGVSSFNGLGKALQLRYPNTLPQKRNLFQKLEVLSDTLSKSMRISLSDIIGEEKFEYLFKMFQVRHIYEHNMGVVDEDFVHKIPSLEYLKGRKYTLKKDEVDEFLSLVLELGRKIIEKLEQN